MAKVEKLSTGPIKIIFDVVRIQNTKFESGCTEQVTCRNDLTHILLVIVKPKFFWLSGV